MTRFVCYFTDDDDYVCLNPHHIVMVRVVDGDGVCNVRVHTIDDRAFTLNDRYTLDNVLDGIEESTR